MNFDFSDKEKIDYFDKICKLFYYSNFGTTQKSEIDLLMFNFYIDTLINKNMQIDGTLDYNACSDYRISKDLGITQHRVRELKIKKQLKYPRDFSWKESFVRLVDNARYDSVNKKIEISIPDPNLYNEIENFIEERGGFIDKQLNRKILKIRIEYFLELIIFEENEKNRKQIINELKKKLQSKSKEENKFDEKYIGKSLIEMSVNITEIIANLSEIISPQNIIGKSIINLLSNLKI
ncbi:MAG: hypothetical protein AAGU14_11250 [Eubacteriaceae bacterium]